MDASLGMKRNDMLPPPRTMPGLTMANNSIENTMLDFENVPFPSLYQPQTEINQSYYYQTTNTNVPDIKLIAANSHASSPNNYSHNNRNSFSRFSPAGNAPLY